MCGILGILGHRAGAGEALLARLRRMGRWQVPYRPRRGFDLTLQEWLSGPFRARVEARLAERRLQGIRYAAVRRQYEACHAGGGAATVAVWQWLVLEEWHAQWIGGEAAPPAPRVVATPAALELLDEAAAAPV
jgi:hypothetical protein